MRPLTYVFFLLLILSTNKSKARILGRRALEDTCKSFAAVHPSIGYNYCVNTFHADNASATADVRGLAAIAAKIAGAAANSTASRIAALCASEEDAGRRERLGVCAEVYSDAVDQLGEAAKDIARGALTSTRDALTQLSAALDAPGTCEDAFGEADDTSPLAAEDAEFRKRATIALGVTALRSPPPSAPGISD